MTIEMTQAEAELLIALLTGAEGAFAVVNPPLVEALRPWRTALMRAYLRERMGQPASTSAVVPVDGIVAEVQRATDR
jgi:hypothetical protein